MSSIDFKPLEESIQTTASTMEKQQKEIADLMQKLIERIKSQNEEIEKRKQEHQNLVVENDKLRTELETTKENADKQIHALSQRVDELGTKWLLLQPFVQEAARFIDKQ